MAEWMYDDATPARRATPDAALLHRRGPVAYGQPAHGHAPDDQDLREEDLHGQYPTEPRATARGQAIANWIGAILSVALIIGISVWGYRLIARDVTGVPVVRALEGPIRVIPDDPGGRQAAYRGLAVNAVAAEGVAAPAPEQVVLAPPPLSLDAPLPEAPTRGLTNVALATDGAASPSDTPPATRLDATGRVLRSPMPPARPLDDLVAAAAAQAVVTALSGGATRAAPEIDPSTLTAGTRLVQLGAYDDRDQAVAEWNKLATRFGALMEGRTRVVQEAESGGEAFYRLRAHGFSDENDARLFCAALLAEQASCIPVLIR